ncbi:MAG TPA: Omp28-related outer membrane protein [Bacteroidales bacterium]|nr:Omp28-related outer membrane protein [Bacteroidales bacterium]
MKRTGILTGIVLSIFFAGCDIVESPYLETDTPVWNGRKILILDFTGHMCGNCPSAHRTLSQLQESYPEAIVPIAVHCGYFGVVATSNPNQPYHYNFNTAVGLELGGNGFTNYGYYNIRSQPIGVVNQLIPEALSAHDAWAGNMAAYYSLFPEVQVQITSVFDESDSSINLTIDVTAQIVSTRNLHLTAYITESHIIEWQMDYTQSPSNVQNYEHNHVLRGSFNGAWGDAINTANAAITRNQKFTKNYSLKTGTDWVPENLSVVAFVYDSDTKEVLQAEEIYVME